jgi:virginiamycin B lyase
MTAPASPSDGPGPRKAREGLIVFSRVARAGIAVIAFFFLLAAPAGSATPEELPPAAMFWAQSPHGAEKEAGTIGRAELSGAGVQESLVAAAPAPADVAVDGHHIYWANYGSGTIGRANLDGSEANEQFISGAESPIGVAVEGGHIYWTNQLIFASEGGAIGRANLDGSDVHQRFIRTRGRPAALAVDSEHVYWTNEYSNRYTAKGYAIGRASLSGAGVEERFIPVSNSTDGVAVNGSFVFWTNVGEHALGRANLNGTGVVPRCITLRTPPLENVPEGVALNGQHVYWTNYPADTIARANLDGSEAVERLLPINGVPAGIAVGDEGGPPSSAGPCPTSKLPLLFGPINPPFAGPYTKGWGEAGEPRSPLARDCTPLSAHRAGITRNLSLSNSARLESGAVSLAEDSSTHASLCGSGSDPADRWENGPRGHPTCAATTETARARGAWGALPSIESHGGR